MTSYETGTAGMGTTGTGAGMGATTGMGAGQYGKVVVTIKSVSRGAGKGRQGAAALTPRSPQVQPGCRLPWPARPASFQPQSPLAYSSPAPGPQHERQGLDWKERPLLRRKGQPAWPCPRLPLLLPSFHSSTALGLSTAPLSYPGAGQRRRDPDAARQERGRALRLGRELRLQQRRPLRRHRVQRE